MNNNPNQIIVASFDKNRFASEIVGAGLIPVYCAPNQTSLYGVKDTSENILLVLVDETEDEVRKLAKYLTVICIDEEKNLFVYGKKNLVDIVKNSVPSLFVISVGYLFTDTFNKTTAALTDFIRKNASRKKPAILFVDINDDYINRIRPHLTRDFDVFSYVGNNGYEISSKVRFCDVVVLSTALNLPVVAFTSLFVAILKKRSKDKNFTMYFMASNADEQNVMNVLEESHFIAISKDRDVKKTAEFLIKRISK